MPAYRWTQRSELKLGRYFFLGIIGQTYVAHRRQGNRQMYISREFVSSSLLDVETHPKHSPSSLPGPYPAYISRTASASSVMAHERLEIGLLLEAIYQRYGHDFREYAFPTVERRLRNRMALEKVDRISDMIHRVVREPDLFERVRADLSINVTELFRDPAFFLALRTQVIPHLKQLPRIRIWHAGCATGEEVFSMAILLYEAGLLDRARIYATDMNPHLLERARKGELPVREMKTYAHNYHAAGGQRDCSEYCHSSPKGRRLAPELLKPVLFAEHNLATDQAFGHMDLILCRNVLIYFQKKLQNRVLTLLAESLGRWGFLCLGMKESLMAFNGSDLFTPIGEKTKIFRKKQSVIR
jgi:chemotaxis protein methyltransferase CheR